MMLPAVDTCWSMGSRRGARKRPLSLIHLNSAAEARIYANCSITAGWILAKIKNQSVECAMTRRTEKLDQADEESPTRTLSDEGSARNRSSGFSFIRENSLGALPLTR
jgi:hypothetical protein